jgi:hypothetical protein
MFGIGIGGAEGCGGSAAAFPEACCSDHGRGRSESPMCFWYLELIVLLQKIGGVEFSIVSSPESLHSLVDRFLIPVEEKIFDFAGPVHGLDLDLNSFGFVGRDDVIHCEYEAPWFVPDQVSRMDLHSGVIIVGWADLVGAVGAH